MSAEVSASGKYATTNVIVNAGAGAGEMLFGQQMMPIRISALFSKDR